MERRDTGREEATRIEGQQKERREEGREGGRILTESLVHHGLLLLFLALFIQQRTEGIPDRERDNGFTLRLQRDKTVKKTAPTSPPTSGYWLTVAIGT